MKMKKILASLILLFVCSILLASCNAINTKPTYKHRVTLEVFVEKMESFELDYKSYFSKDFVLKSTESEKTTEKTIYIETDTEVKSTFEQSYEREIQYDKTNNALAITGKNIQKSNLKSNTEYESGKVTNLTDTKIEGSNTTTRIINNINKSLTESELSFDNIFNSYINSYSTIPFNILSNARYYIDGDKYTIVKESGLISSISSNTSISITQVTFKNDSLVIKNYSKDVETKNTDEETLELETVSMETTVIETKDITLEKTMVTGYTTLD